MISKDTLQPEWISKVSAARAAYLAKLIETGEKNIVRFENAQQIVDWQIEASFDTRLNKLKKSNPEGFFYWYQVYLLEEKVGKE